MTFYDRIGEQLEELKRSGQYRFLREPEPGLLNLSSNDYLGLNLLPELREAFYQLVRDKHFSADFALSASSSRLLTGNHRPYLELEAYLSRMYEGRAALVFNSGYHANIGIIPALTSKRDLVLCDKLNHASIIDGIRLSEAQFRRYPHLDYARLAELLEAGHEHYENIFIVSESVFSMDGDLADLRMLAGLKRQYKNVVLIVDEAHAVGIFGRGGRGLAAGQGVAGDIDIIIGTFGKAYCSAGAYAIMDELLREFLVNKMRSLIFTTALPPMMVSWSRFVLGKCAKPEMEIRRRQVLRLGEKLRSGLQAKGLKTDGESQIVPLIVGENDKALALAAKLRAAGLLVFAIRPPTIPPGTARLRFSLHAGLSEGDIDKILELV
ncbi:MAG: 8-amino-7-oxononanoate synthase [Victivallales bacterium]|nr:8-amino-7-oxononanoate synthase [Victivallales bacterium]